jgi:hypothetical protein
MYFDKMEALASARGFLGDCADDAMDTGSWWYGCNGAGKGLVMVGMIVYYRDAFVGKRVIQV